MWNYLYLPSSLAVDVVSFPICKTMFHPVAQTDMEFTVNEATLILMKILLQLPEF